MLNITNDGRKVSLDPKLLDVSDPDIQPMEGGKVQVCAEKIHEIWRERAEEKATQLVFCDSSTTASGKWNIQSDLKRRLVDLGIPEDEIMFAAQEKDPQRKQALFEKVRKGEVRVLIGSTGTLGTGTNVQDRLFAIHDLDCPWKPAELEQRQGRVRRQGNMFDNVQDYRYVTVGTFDSYMFQTVERKARFISQIMSSGSPSREASDVDATVLSLADMKAIATGDPNIAKRMELENQLTQMKLLKRAHADQQRSIRFKIDMQLQPTVDHLERLHGEALDDEPEIPRSRRDPRPASHPGNMRPRSWQRPDRGPQTGHPRPRRHRARARPRRNAGSGRILRSDRHGRFTEHGRQRTQRVPPVRGIERRA